MSSSASETSPSLSAKKILVFAGTPPPIHGQNVMVAALIEGLRKDSRFQVVHIDPRLSRSNDEVGQKSFGKLMRLAWACARALAARLREGPMVLYYVPAPGKKTPVVRDWIVLLICRCFFQKIVLHWHAVGLGAWTTAQPGTFTSYFTHRALDQADLAIVLAPELADDAKIFRPRKVAVVPNGIPDPVTSELAPKLVVKPQHDVLFLGLGSEAKGLFVSVEAVRLANTFSSQRFRFTFAGSFASPEDEQRFVKLMQSAGDWIRRVGVVSGLAKATLLRESDVLSFPTQYPHEGQPLVLIEALAFDLPIVTTRWRSIPGMLPKEHIAFVDPANLDEMANAIYAACQRRNESTDTGWDGEMVSGKKAEGPGALRAHFLAHFTLEKHLEAMKRALLEA
jgi:glycosyltransferase involved in cell wall biosynthesis